MKSIKEHMMFILPLMAILLGMEFFLVFNRVTRNYEEKLKENYSILVVTSRPVRSSVIEKVDRRIVNVKSIKKEEIAKEIVDGLSQKGVEEILEAIPFFYTLNLSSYLNREEINKIAQKLLNYPVVKKVETFGESHRSKYNLFLFLKIIFWSFVSLMSMISIFLIVKQMEVWQMAHQERMKIMEIFGAPMMLRSGVLFRIAITDAVIATLLSVGFFIFLKYYWIPKSGIEFLIEKTDMLFGFLDVVVLLIVVLTIVVSAVFIVTLGNRESVE